MIEKTEVLTIKSFTVAGLAVRTCNAGGRSISDIGNLWTRFTSENLPAQIKEKLSDDIYCIYTDYEGDHNGWYTAVLGCKVKGENNGQNDGITIISIPAGKYEAYTLSGKFPEKLAVAWAKIWNGNAHRNYKADYDLYLAGAKSFEETDVRIFVGIN